MDAAFALHDFQQHGGGLVGDGGFERGQVVVGDVAETGHQRLEGLAVFLLPGGRERAHGAPVEAAHGRRRRRCGRW